MPQAKNDSYPEIEEIREDLNSLKGNVVELTKHIQSDGYEQVGEIGALAKKRIRSAKVKGLQEMKKLEKQVKEKPAQSLAIAFGAGLLASMLLHGRA